MIVALALLLALGQDPAVSSASSPCRVLLTHDRADPSWYQEIGTIQFTKRRNASSGAARKELAKRAHKLGADAVINVSLESKRTVWSFPHSIMDASGKAVKWTPIGLEKSYELSGSCFNVKGKEEARPATVAKDKKVPWDVIIAGAVVGAAAYGAYQLAKDDNVPPSASTPAHPRHAPSPPPSEKPKKGISLGALGAPASTEIIVLSGDNSRTYLGCLSCSDYDTSSVRNDYGRFSRYGGESIRNRYSQYGSPYSSTSACSRYATQPPVIVDRSGQYYGELTMNTSRPNRTRTDAWLLWLAAVCQE